MEVQVLSLRRTPGFTLALKYALYPRVLTEDVPHPLEQYHLISALGTIRPLDISGKAIRIFNLPYKSFCAKNTVHWPARSH